MTGPKPLIEVAFGCELKAAAGALRIVTRDMVCAIQRWRVAAACLSLAAITLAVFGQTLSHDFVNFDDDAHVYENRVVTQGLTIKGFVWAFEGRSRRELPSLDLALPHAGLPTSMD